MAWTCPACGFETEGDVPPRRCLACDAPLPQVRSSGDTLATGAEGATTRRGFFQAAGVVAGLGALAAASHIVYRYLQPAAPLESPADVVLDPPAAYPEGRTFVAEAKAFVERRGGELRCLSAVCPHLGCLVLWDDGRRQYHCPCHNSDFSADGRRLTGPASLPLAVLGLSLNADGRLVVHRRRTASPADEWLQVGDGGATGS